MADRHFHFVSPSSSQQRTSDRGTSAKYWTEQPAADFATSATTQYIATTNGLDWEPIAEKWVGDEAVQQGYYPALPRWPVYPNSEYYPRLYDPDHPPVSYNTTSVDVEDYYNQSAICFPTSAPEASFPTYQYHDDYRPPALLSKDLKAGIPTSNMPTIERQSIEIITKPAVLNGNFSADFTDPQMLANEGTEGVTAAGSRVNAKRKQSHDISTKPSSKSASKQAKRKQVAIIKGDRGKQSRAESCWRCRRYKKPCNKSDHDCSSCITSGFRIWPSSLGCRRGQMTDYVSLIIPSNIEILKVVPNTYMKPTSWRKTSTAFDGHFGPATLTQLDHWDQLIHKIRCIRILGPGITELLTIAANYERRRDQAHPLLTVTARCLSTTIDLYSLFVATCPGETFETNDLPITNIFLTLRQLLMSSVQRFLTSCLTGRVREWFPTFMAVNILGLVYILLGDTILVLPHHEEIWPDIKKTILQLREFHPMTRDLLTVLGKGCSLLDLNWHGSRDARRLMDHDDATVQAMCELQVWRERLMQFLRDDAWMEVPPFERDLVPVAALSRLFVSVGQDAGVSKKRKIDAG